MYKRQIQHQNAALPSELFTAAVYLQAGRTPAEVSGLAREGRLMGFFGPERPEELSRIATCTIVESGREQRFYTCLLYTSSPKAGRILANFGAWLPKFKKILPHDYDRMLRTIAWYEAQGMGRVQAETEAFYVNARGKGD